MSTSYFRNAQNVDIQNLTFTNQMASSGAFDHLHNNIAVEAIHNSAERCDAPKCHPETRIAVQEEILSWITDGDHDEHPKKILWVTGPAGAGKTAIAGSIAETCEDKGLLAGSFFFSSFSGTGARRWKRYLVGTLVHCMLQHDGLQALRGPILTVIERDPSVFQKRLMDQCKLLLLKPFRELAEALDSSSLPKVIVIDGLDEAEAPNSRGLDTHEARLANEAEQVEILSTLLQAADDPSFPFRIIIVSRPEPVIRGFFSSKASHTTGQIFLDDKYDPGSDILRFLQAKFAEIRRRYRLPEPWPEEQMLERLQHRASGQFIYAATVIRFLQTSKLHPEARLDRIRSLLSPQPDGNVLSPLDALYSTILNSSPDPPLAVNWLGAISIPFCRPASFTRQLLQDYHGQAEYLLENLASLIVIPALDDDLTPYGFYHRTLDDYLSDETRCGAEMFHEYVFGDRFLVYSHEIHVLRAKSPVVPLTDDEWRRFVPLFFWTFGNLFLSPSDEEGDLYELPSCDILWWMETLDSVRSDTPERASLMVTRIFQVVHDQCPDVESFADCRRSCKQWRSNILRGFQALGWRVPNAIDLLRHRMLKEVGCDEDAENRDNDIGWCQPNMAAYFEAPGGRSTSASSIAPSRGHPTASSLCVLDQDYEATFSLADSLYARLPESWRLIYRQEILGPPPNSSPFNVLRSHIAEIAHEMGVDIEDDDVTSAWEHKYLVLYDRPFRVWWKPFEELKAHCLHSRIVNSFRV